MNSRQHRRLGTGRGGFTILEILVSIALLALVVVLMAGVIEVASRSWQTGKAQADNYAKARSALDLVAREVRAAVLREDVAAFKAPDGSSDFRFVSVRPATQGERDLQTLRYAVGGLATPSPQQDDIGLFRTSQKWAFADRPSLASTLELSGTAQTEQIGPGILGFAYRFYTANGTPSPSFVFNYEDPTAPGNTAVMRIACVVVDDRTLDLMVTRGSLKPLVERIQDDALTEPASPITKWKASCLELVDTGVLTPKENQGIRIFEFTLPLPTPHG